MVGYQNKALNNGKSTYVCQTIKNMTDTVQNQKLGDWVPSPEFELDDDSIYFWDENGDISGHYTYLHDFNRGTMGIPADATVGWYNWDDVDNDWNFTNCQNDLPVPFGTMAMVLTSYGATINFAGEVRDTETVLPLNNGKSTFIGNCSPVDLKLGYIKPTEEFELDDDSIYFWDENGDIEGHYTYLQAANRGTMGIPDDATVGWYTWEDVDNDWDFSDCQNEKKLVKAGDSFMALTSYGASIKIPAPIPAQGK